MSNLVYGKWPTLIDSPGNCCLRGRNGNARDSDYAAQDREILSNVTFFFRQKFSI